MKKNNFILIILLTTLLSACGAKMDLNSHGIDSNNNDSGAIDHNPQGQGNGGENPGPTNPVCDPFTNEPMNSSVNGLQATLKFKDSHKKWIYSVNQILFCGKKAPADFYFNRVFVPTMNWDSGFTMPDGTVLKDKQGSVVIDAFAMKMKTRVVLRDDQEEGYYQFALLSNDGARASIKHKNIPFLINIVNDDGVHETKFTCSCFGVFMKKGKPVDLVIKFMQKNAPTMTNILVWRKLPDPKKKKHFIKATKPEVCGLKGDDKFFELNTGVNKEGFNQILMAGFKPLDSSNFLLPKEGQTNPCAAQ